MNTFLAPMDYHRAWNVLHQLQGYTSYSEEGAAGVHALLKENYPLIFQKMEQKPFARGALLLEMSGANTADPLLFVSHLDAQVQPTVASPQTLDKENPPKPAALEHAHVVALLEALEALLSNGYRPGGDLLIALSMDGLSGAEGAQSVAEHLKTRGLQPCFVLDFGGYVTRSAFCTFLPPDAPLAMIGISEKGLLQGTVTADRTAFQQSASLASPLNALLRSGARLSRRSRTASLCKTSEQMLLALSKRAPMPQRMLVTNPRLTFPLLRLLWRKRAIMRQFFVSERILTGLTCTGETAREPDNAVLSFRQSVVPGQKLSEWTQQLRKTVGNKNLALHLPLALEHSARSQTGGAAWDALGTAIEILFDRVVIVPCLSPYVTDGRFYTSLRGNVYRFSPFLLTGRQALAGECMVTDDTLQTAVQFFRQMLSV